MNLVNKELKASVARASILDGMFWAVMFGLGESYVGAFGVHLNLSPTLIGALASIPLMIGAISQLIAVKLLDQHLSRRYLLVKTVIYQAALWILIALLSVFDLGVVLSGYVLLILVTLHFVLAYIAKTIWTSLLGDLVPSTIRGRFFGGRAFFEQSSVLLSLLFAGIALEYGRIYGFANHAFFFIFILASFARFISAYWLFKHEDPPYCSNLEDRFSFTQFILRIPNSNFARFSLFHALMHLVVYISGPFMLVYMLQELQLGFFQYSILASSLLLSSAIFNSYWGRAGDRHGHKLIFSICSWGLIITSSLWLFGDQFYYLIFVQFISGIFWSGFSLAAGNFLLDAVTPAKRGRCSAYLWILTTTAMVIGSLVGGQLLSMKQGQFLEVITFGLFQSDYMALVVVSSFLRFLLCLFFLHSFKEVRVKN